MEPNTGTGTTETLTVVVQVEPAPPSEERMQDLLVLFGLVILALVTVWGLKQILNLFTINPDSD
jgi:flagellar biogenesis protein FliO